jgi:hypothetical protein
LGIWNSEGSIQRVAVDVLSASFFPPWRADGTRKRRDASWPLRSLSGLARTCEFTVRIQNFLKMGRFPQ